MRLDQTGTALLKVSPSDILEDGSFTIPDGITAIAPAAFGECRDLQTIALPQGLTKIREEAFYNCSSLHTITLPQGLTRIYDFTFSGCSSLQAITLPPGINVIRYRAFYNCSSLQTITLSPGITFICNDAFDGCNNLHSIIIDGPSEARERIKLLLPVELQDKVTSAELADQAYQELNNQLASIANIAKLNPLYRYLNTNVSDHETVCGILKNEQQQDIQMEYPLLPDELFQHINGFMEHTLAAHQHAKDLMHRQPLPRNEDQLLTYRRALERIANTTLGMYTQNYKSDFEKYLYFLKKKGAFFVRNHQMAAAEVVETLYQQLMYSYINTLPQNGLQFQNECRQAIQAAHTELEQHRGWKLILSYLLLTATGLGALVVLADVGYHYATGQHFSFFQTTTEKQLHALEKLATNDMEFPELEAGAYRR